MQNKEAPNCEQCNKEHSQFFKCPHYKGGKLRAQKFCEKLAEKQLKQKRSSKEEEKTPAATKQVKFAKEIDVLPFVPKHVVTITGPLNKKSYVVNEKEQTARMEKDPVWKQVMAALEKYRGLTMSCPGVKQALTIEFGPECLIFNSKLFREKLQQLSREDVAKGIDARKKTAVVKEATLLATKETVVHLNLPKEVIELKDQVEHYESSFKEFREQTLKDYDYLTSEWKKVDKSMFEYDMAITSERHTLQVEGDKIHKRLDRQVDMYGQLYRRDALRGDQIDQLDIAVQKCNDTCSAFETTGNKLMADMELASRVFTKNAERFRKAAKKINQLCENQDKTINIFKNIDYRLNCQEQKFSMPKFMDGLIESVVSGKPYHYQ